MFFFVHLFVVSSQYDNREWYFPSRQSRSPSVDICDASYACPYGDRMPAPSSSTSSGRMAGSRQNYLRPSPSSHSNFRWYYNDRAGHFEPTQYGSSPRGGVDSGGSGGDYTGSQYRDTRQGDVYDGPAKDSTAVSYCFDKLDQYYDELNASGQQAFGSGVKGLPYARTTTSVDGRSTASGNDYASWQSRYAADEIETDPRTKSESVSCHTGMIDQSTLMRHKHRDDVTYNRQRRSQSNSRSSSLDKSVSDIKRSPRRDHVVSAGNSTVGGGINNVATVSASARSFNKEVHEPRETARANDILPTRQPLVVASSARKTVNSGHDNVYDVKHKQPIKDTSPPSEPTKLETLLDWSPINGSEYIKARVDQPFPAVSPELTSPTPKITDEFNASDYTVKLKDGSTNAKGKLSRAQKVLGSDEAERKSLMSSAVNDKSISNGGSRVVSPLSHIDERHVDETVFKPIVSNRIQDAIEEAEDDEQPFQANDYLLTPEAVSTVQIIDGPDDRMESKQEAVVVETRTEPEDRQVTESKSTEHIVNADDISCYDNIPTLNGDVEITEQFETANSTQNNSLDYGVAESNSLDNIERFAEDQPPGDCEPSDELPSGAADDKFVDYDEQIDINFDSDYLLPAMDYSVNYSTTLVGLTRRRNKKKEIYYDDDEFIENVRPNRPTTRVTTGNGQDTAAVGGGQNNNTVKPADSFANDAVASRTEPAAAAARKTLAMDDSGYQTYDRELSSLGDGQQLTNGEFPVGSPGSPNDLFNGSQSTQSARSVTPNSSGKTSAGTVPIKLTGSANHQENNIRTLSVESECSGTSMSRVEMDTELSETETVDRKRTNSRAKNNDSPRSVSDRELNNSVARQVIAIMICLIECITQHEFLRQNCLVIALLILIPHRLLFQL